MTMPNPDACHFPPDLLNAIKVCQTAKNHSGGIVVAGVVQRNQAVSVSRLRILTHPYHNK